MTCIWVMVWTTVWVTVWGKAVMVTVEGEPVPKTVVVTKESCKFPVLFVWLAGLLDVLHFSGMMFLTQVVPQQLHFGSR